jgi:hypothetical protein
MIKIGGLPVKTRVPLAVWVFAAFLTLLSVVSSTVHYLADTPWIKVASVSAPQQTTGRTLHASLN